MSAREDYDLALQSIIQVARIEGQELSREAAEQVLAETRHFQESHHEGFRRCPNCHAVKGIYQDVCPLCGCRSKVT